MTKQALLPATVESESMKRLFQVGGEYFETKVAAKAARGPAADGKVVSKGPDHWSYGLKGTTTTHSNAPKKRK
jgi:hypothetical protein